MRDRVHRNPRPSRHIRKNLRFWEAGSDRYESEHRQELEPVWAAWGLWRIPERRLALLGEVRGKRILEYGCGAARWSISLARRGASVVGLDFSARHLEHATRLLRRHPAAVDLVRADAEATPFRDGSFDVVFCDWGAMTFCDPRRTIPEVARLLAPGGVFAFSTGTPIRAMSTDTRSDRISARMRRAYFDLNAIEYPDTTDFQIPYGAWLGLFHRHGLHVEALIEPEGKPGLRSGYLTDPENHWSRSWPAENIWKLRKWSEDGKESPTANSRREGGAGRSTDRAKQGHQSRAGTGSSTRAH